MEFADWIVSGLDQLRTGQLPGGHVLYQTVSAGLGGNPVVDGFMNTGDPAARAHLVQAIAQAVATNPGFEQQLRASAAAAQGPAAGPAKTPFLKTSNGIVVFAVAAVLVVGGGVGLAVGVSGSSDSGSGGFAKTLIGTWNCTTGEGSGTITIGAGTWSLGKDSGTWTRSGSTATLTNKSHPGEDIKVGNVPSGAGPFDITLTGSPSHVAHLKGSVSAHQMTATFSMPSSEENLTFTCTK